MRVSENVPQFTFGFSGCFVNGFYAVSTVFLLFFSAFVRFNVQNRDFTGEYGRDWQSCRQNCSKLGRKNDSWSMSVSGNGAGLRSTSKKQIPYGNDKQRRTGKG